MRSEIVHYHLYCYPININNNRVKFFVNIDRDDLLLERIKNSIPKKDEQKFCNLINKILEGLEVKYEMVSIKLTDSITTIPAIIVYNEYVSLLNHAMLAFGAYNRHEKKLLLSSTHHIIKYLYQTLCIENISDEDPAIVEMVKIIYEKALREGHIY